MTTPQQTTLSLSLFGDLSEQAGDRLPSFAFLGVRRADEPIPTEVRPRKVKRATLPTLGTIVSAPVTDAPKEPELPQFEELEPIEVDFPDIEEIDDPRFDGINYNKHDYGVVGENEIEVPDVLLNDIRDQTLTREEQFRTALFESASLLFAHEDASNFVEAALRDGLGMELEMDEAIGEAFVPLARLNTLVAFVNMSTTLPESVKKTLLGRLTIKTADEMILALNKRKIPDAIAAMHKHYAATVKQSGIESDIETNGPQNTLGVRASRK